MDLINENYGPVFDDVDKMNALMKEKKAQITEAEGFPEMPGIKEALKQLKDEGYLLAVASSSPAYAIKDALKSLDMEKYFTVVMSGDYVEHPGYPAFRNPGCGTRYISYRLLWQLLHR